ncbi:hypothetical protein Tco_0459546 [Tanacetum coccineum]
MTPREPTFHVVLDAIALTPCYPAFLITADVPEICPRVPGRDFNALPSEEDTVYFLREPGHTGVINSLNDVVVDQIHQPWITFATLINRGLSGKTSGLNKLRLSRAQILWGMFYQKNVGYVELLWEDFVYQIENKVYKKQEKIKRINSDLLLECLTSPAMKESKAYKTYLGYATGAVPPKIARKFKKASPTKKESDLVPVDEEPVTKGKRVKRSVKKSLPKPATGIVIRDPPVETKSKRKEEVDVSRIKGIDLLSEVALTEEARMKEVRKKSLRDFKKTHPSGFGMVAKKPPRVDKIIPTVTSEGTGDKPGVPDVTNDDSTKSESESWGNDEDNSNNEQESSDESNKQENESEEQESDSEKEEESKGNNQEEEEFVHAPTYTDDKDDDNLESKNARLKEPTQTDKEVVQDAHVTISTVMKKTEVPVTSSSRSSDLALKFLKFSNIPHANAEIVSLQDVHVHHEVPRTQAPTLLTIPISIITESSHLFTNIPQSSQTFTPSPMATPTPPTIIETTNPLSTLPDFSSVFRFNDRITTLEKEVAKLKKDPLHTQVTTLVDEHLDTRLGETKKEFKKFLSDSLTARIKEQVKDQLPHILPKEVSNFAPPVIETLIKESREEINLSKVSSQTHSSYEAASTLTEFELKKILIDKIEKSESYLADPEHRDCYYGLKKSYDLDKDYLYSYDVYSLKRSRKGKDKDEDPSTRLDRGLKNRKTSKDAEPTTCSKKKDSTSGSSKGSKSQPKSFGKSVHSEEPVFEVTDSDMPHDQEGDLVDNEDEPRKEDASKRDWFKKPTPPQEPTNPDWNIGKTTQEGPTQNWLINLAASTSTDKLLKDFDELMSTPIYFSSYILNGLKIKNLTQKILLGPAFKLLKGTHSNYAELEYDFEECYKALSEKFDWENPKGGDYPFDLSKPLSLITRGKRQRVPVEFFINNDLKYLQGWVSTMTYMTSTTKTKVTQYDLLGIEDMVPNIWSPVKVAYDKYTLWGILHLREQRKSFYAFARGMQSRGDVYSTKRILTVTHVSVMRKHGYGYLEEIVVRRVDNNRLTNLSGDDVADFAIALRMFTKSLVIQKRVEDLQLRVESYQKQINVTKPDTTRPDLRKRHTYTPYKDPQGFIYVDDFERNRLMRSDKLYKFSDGTLTRLLSSLKDITKNIDMTYLSKRRWSKLEKKRAYFMIKDINKLLKERRMMRSLEKFIGGRLYETDLRLLQRTI